MMKTLRDAKVGSTVQVVEAPWGRRGKAPDHGHGHHQRRRDLHPQGGPLGDPMEVNIRGYELSLRKTDCEMIEIL